MTNANLFLGHLVPDCFLKTFGPNENEPLDVEVIRQKFSELADQINAEIGPDTDT